MKQSSGRSMLSRIPYENEEILWRLFAIEIVLREFIIEESSRIWGERWWKQRVMGDVKESAQDRLERERQHRWNQVVPHHPIYYTDFPHLKKLAENAQFWSNCFAPHFGNDKSVLTARLTSLEPIRNKVAHNRHATYQDLSILRGAYDFISGALGASRFDELTLRCTTAPEIGEILRHLLSDMEHTWTACSNFDSPPSLRDWDNIRRAWWFDPDYLMGDLQTIVDYYNYISAYQDLPHHAGTGHVLQS